ncbi:MAG: 2-hydroxyacyl-CoA dehydratase family protein [Dehalococcoidia bacterium]
MVKQRELLTTYGKAKQLMSAYMEEINRAKKEGVPIVWNSIVIPRELTAAYDVVSVPGEWYSATSGPSQGIELLETAEACGFPHEVCAYSRLSIGSMIAEKGFLGEFPKPDVVIGLEGGCNLEAKWMEFIARYYNVPLFIFDYHSPCYVSPKHQEQAERDAVEYFVQQAYRYIDFMEQATGQKLNEEKLINAHITRNTNAEVWQQIAELWESVPSPMSFKDLLAYLPFSMFLCASPEELELARSLRDELAQRVKDGVSGIPEERIRLYFSAPPPWYHLQLLRYLESRGIAVVGSIYYSSNRFPEELLTGGEAIGGWLNEWSEPTNVDECLMEIAKKWAKTLDYLVPPQHTYLNLKRRVAQTIERCRVARVDGVVFHCPRGCRKGSIGQLDMRNAVRQALNIPTLIYEGSPSDPRDYARAAVESSMSTFLEQVIADKERKARSGNGG